MVGGGGGNAGATNRLDKGDHAQEPLIGWARGLKFRDHREIGHGDNAQGAPTVGQGDHD
jgi:hypothetical protein